MPRFSSAARCCAFALHLAAAVTASAGEAEQLEADGGCPAGGCGEEVALLQEKRWHRKPAAPDAPPPHKVYEQVKCTPECFNGGVCRNDVCHCNAGFCGDLCEWIEEIVSEEVGTPEMPEERCALGFKVFPYVQPELWATAYEGWEDCGGSNQSPININMLNVRWTNGPPLQQNYSAADYLRSLNNGHALEVDGNWGTVNMESVPPGTRWELKTNDIHFHVPSEHRVNGRRFPMEMHIVNKKPREDDPMSFDIGVVGILFRIGKENECIKNIMVSNPPRAGCDMRVGTIDLSCFSRQLEGPFWSYEGSLTTPPCSENVRWNVMRYTATISRQQLENYRTRYRLSARPVQPRNGRTVEFNNFCRTSEASGDSGAADDAATV